MAKKEILKRLLDKEKKGKDLNSVVDTFKKQDREVKIDDFRNVVIKIPNNINAEVPEDKNGFLFDTNSGRVYALNKTGSFIFRKIQEGMSLSEIAKQLMNSYDTEESIAVSDIQDFLYQLKEYGIGSEE